MTSPRSLETWILKHSVWEDKSIFLEDQSKSDLSKSIHYVNSLGVTEIDVIGVEGGTMDMSLASSPH